MSCHEEEGIWIQRGEWGEADPSDLELELIRVRITLECLERINFHHGTIAVLIGIQQDPTGIVIPGTAVCLETPHIGTHK